jgi:hypothetical protein
VGGALLIVKRRRKTRLTNIVKLVEAPKTRLEKNDFFFQKKNPQFQANFSAYSR